MSKSTMSNQSSDMLRAFAAAIDPGLILIIGGKASHYCNTILKSMGVLSKLVVNLAPDTSRSEIDLIVESDIRAAVHRQRPIEFLSDVHRHNLNLVIIDEKKLSLKLAEHIEEMLVDGGCLIVLNAQKRLRSEMPILARDFYSLEIGADLLLVKKAYQQPTTRRGGRRRRARLTDFN